MSKVHALTSSERKIALCILGAFFMRVFGMVAILPVFALFATQLQGSQPIWTGLALGIYGFSQALFQIPLGMLSDYIGRKPVVYLGFLFLGVGSFLCLTATSMFQIILGRACQGACAIGSTLLAALADATRAEQRSKAMAIVGAGLGLAFVSSMVLGPVLSAFFGARGIFFLTIVLSLMGAVIISVGLPSRKTMSRKALKQPLGVLKDCFGNGLGFLYLSILMIHAVLIANFTVLPVILNQSLGLSQEHLWAFYLPVLVSSFLLMYPLMRLSENRCPSKRILLAAAIAMGLSEWILGYIYMSAIGVLLGMLVFFTAFCLLEAVIPSQISKRCESLYRGRAMGMYSTAQFLGILLGGVWGGWVHQHVSLHGVFLANSFLLGLWCVSLLRFPNPWGARGSLKGDAVNTSL